MKFCVSLSMIDDMLWTRECDWCCAWN